MDAKTAVEGYGEPPAYGTSDEKDMARFGKKQRFKRNFNLLSIVGITCTMTLTWEGVLVLLQPIVANGGPTGAFGGFIFAWAGVTLQTLVMAEIASMIPLAGGTYNWVSYLSPPQYSKFLSYITGWVTIIAWQALYAASTYLEGTIIQALVVLSYPDYKYERWQGSLIMYAVILAGYIMNTVLARLLPAFEITMLTAHILGFVGTLVTICVLGPKNDASVVWDTFINGGGWPTDGQSFLIGSVSSMFLFTGVDAASHMAEEIKNAAKIIPRSMITSILLNGLLGLGMLVASLYAMGPPSYILSSTFFFPIVPILAKITKSTASAVALISILLVVAISGSFGVLTASSRMLWAFAREGAVPASQFLSRVEPRTTVPVWSITVSVTIAVLLGLINIGSTAAFNAFTTLSVAAYYSTFFIAAAVMLYRRIATPDELRYGPFRLGIFGIPVTILAMAYSIVGWFFSFWPPYAAVTVQNFNWSVVVYFGTIIIAVAWWFIHARKTYTGPKIEL